MKRPRNHCGSRLGWSGCAWPERGDAGGQGASLDDLLKRRARGNQASGAIRTFVVAEGSRVVAYYAIASGGMVVDSAFGRFRRNMPDPIPVVLLWPAGSWAGASAGSGLCAPGAARGGYDRHSGIVVHAISEQAQAFYLAMGSRFRRLIP
jgi:hypothetical protein